MSNPQKILIYTDWCNFCKYSQIQYYPLHIVDLFRGLLFHWLLYSYLSSNPERFVCNIVVRVIQHLIKHIRMPTIIDLKHQYICNADGKLRIFSKWIKFHNIQQNKSLIYFANKLFIISLCSHNTIIQSLLQKKLWLLVKTKPKIFRQKINERISKLKIWNCSNFLCLIIKTISVSIWHLNH